MYDFIEGNIDRISPTHVVVENGGMGYLLAISIITYERIKNAKQTRLFVEQSFKVENQSPVAMVLYGFSEPEERSMFQMLTSVSGVGKNTGILMLSALEPEVLSSAIVNGNIGLLKSIKGIGEKSAQRIVLELKDKIGLGKKGVGSLAPTGMSDSVIEATAALSTLGYSRKAIDKTLAKISKSGEDVSVEALIKEALKLM
jgi:holliday junction DNA helicase RuvA